MMELKIKNDCLDLNVSRPDNGKTIWLRELDTQEYDYWYKHGYQWIFQEEIEPKIIKK